MSEHDSDEPRQDPEFGPGGYLPERASKRARKIVLRAPLGVQWIVASVVAGLIVVLVGVVFLRDAGSPPGAPFVEVGPVDDIGAERFEADIGVLLSGAGGRIRAFAVDDLGSDDRPRWCEPSRRFESTSGRVWSATGRSLDGGASLQEHPTVTFDGIVYVDPTRTSAGPSPLEEDPAPACG